MANQFLTAVLKQVSHLSCFILEPGSRRKVFDKFEHEKTGFLKYSNIFLAIEKLGLNPPKEEVDQLVATYVLQVSDGIFMLRNPNL